MKQIYVIEELCNGCRLCQTFCSSLPQGIFSETAHIQVVKAPGEECDTPVVNCDGKCVRPIYDNDIPTCVAVCPTGALLYAEQLAAEEARQDWENARRQHSLFKVIAPWKWPLPWRKTEEQKTIGGQHENTL